ncbi:MAG: hypothetical protein K2Y71_04555 [Xanthobacteraceae bacterium]|nr:hypothetical protein [Xanthobacteraceae bacterium]
MRPRTLTAEVKIRTPPRLVAALERAAARQLSNVSVYAREALVARLRHDGCWPDDETTDAQNARPTEVAL